MTRVGILGGGQLGAMLASALQDLGAEVWVHDPDPDAPALKRAARATSAPWSDAAALQALFDGCDVVTYEFENVETAGLARISGLERLHPSLDVLRTAQDRILEKEFFRSCRIPHADCRSGRALDELLPAAADLGLPAILKTARGGYDGKGQWRVESTDALRALAGGPEAASLAAGWVLEEPVRIEREVSAIVAREADGKEVLFPLFENDHADHVLDTTLVPARLAAGHRETIARVSRAAARDLGVVGLLTMEFFVGRGRRDGEGKSRVFANELAPRPHNSGHVTRRACTASQFEALARVLLGVPLTRPRLLSRDAYCMVNLLGEVFLAQRSGDAAGSALDLGAWAEHPEVLEVVLYGKRVAAPRRKMGHATVRASSAEAALGAARRFREALRRPPAPRPRRSL